MAFLLLPIVEQREMHKSLGLLHLYNLIYNSFTNYICHLLSGWFWLFNAMWHLFISRNSRKAERKSILMGSPSFNLKLNIFAIAVYFVVSGKSFFCCSLRLVVWKAVIMTFMCFNLLSGACFLYNNNYYNIIKWVYKALLFEDFFYREEF